ncbi:hypothetical protein NL676_022802 [Syzygium grande]|nr:hypothetical protein NL676_022802 [Syzygium grande]
MCVPEIKRRNLLDLGALQRLRKQTESWVLKRGFCWLFFLKALLLHKSAPNDGGCDGDDFADSTSSAAPLGPRTCPSPRLHHLHPSPPTAPASSRSLAAPMSSPPSAASGSG